MIAIAKPFPRKSVSSAWHAGFLAMVPAIERHAQVVFRDLNPDAREEAVQAVVCHCCVAYQRLADLGKTAVAYPGPLARFAVAQVRAGRRTGGKLNCRDVSSAYCRMKKNIVMERLDQRDDEGGWAEILIESPHAGPADTAATRIDFSSWLELLPRRLRKIAVFLGNGETTSAASQRFRLSQGRISQIRRQLYEAWHQFQGDVVGVAPV